MTFKWHKSIMTDDFQNNLWTLLASGVSPAYLFLVILVVTRWVGLAEAGMISFAAAIGMLSYSLVTFGARTFQGSDVSREFSFQTYFGMRVCSALLTVVIMAVFLSLGRFETTRAIVIILMFFIYLTDGFADVFMGDLQQKGKMRVAGRMRVCAFVSSFIAFATSLFMIRSIIIPLIISCIVLFVAYIAWIWFYRMDFGRIRIKYDMAVIKTISRNVFPLFIGLLICSYLYNMQKYYLGFLSTDESVAILSILVLPATALNLLCFSFFGGAEMTKTSEILASGRISDLSRRINRQLMIALALAVFYVLCAYTFGLELLSWLYATDLSQYRSDFMIVILGGTLFAVFAVLYSSMVVLRRQKAFLFSTLAIASVTAPLIWFAVARYGITGAAFTNLTFLAPLTVALFVICRVGIRRVAVDG